MVLESLLGLVSVVVVVVVVVVEVVVEEATTGLKLLVVTEQHRQ
jgi:hypothetical protein